MSQSSTQAAPAIGFYTAEYSEAIGWTGGYLLLNTTGRPLEFHCTLPVRPTRAHEILYGTTLRSHLIGELIGQALMKQTRVRPQIVCVDQVEALRLADQIEFPIAIIGGDAVNLSHLTSVPLQVAGGAVRAEGRFVGRIQKILESFPDLPDVEEPFLRIREAVREAQQGATGVSRAA